MNVDMVQLLRGSGIECPLPDPINYPGYVPNLCDVRAAGELQPTVPPMEVWCMGYLYSHALARVRYAQQLLLALGDMLQAGIVPLGSKSIVLLVVRGLEYHYKVEDIPWYEGRLHHISTKLCAYYQPPDTRNKEAVPHEG